MGVLTYGGLAIVLLLYPGMETIAFNLGSTSGFNSRCD